MGKHRSLYECEFMGKDKITDVCIQMILDEYGTWYFEANGWVDEG